MSELITELFVRAIKVVAATLIGVVVYLILIGPISAVPSATLAVLAWIVGALVVLLLESGPI